MTRPQRGDIWAIPRRHRRDLIARVLRVDDRLIVCRLGRKCGGAPLPIRTLPLSAFAYAHLVRR